MEVSKWLRKIEPLITHPITTDNIIQHITLHKASYQQYLASKAAVNVFRNMQKDPTKHPHYKNHKLSPGKHRPFP